MVQADISWIYLGPTERVQADIFWIYPGPTDMVQADIPYVIVSPSDYYKFISDHHSLSKNCPHSPSVNKRCHQLYNPLSTIRALVKCFNNRIGHDEFSEFHVESILDEVEDGFAPTGIVPQVDVRFDIHDDLTILCSCLCVHCLEKYLKTLGVTLPYLGKHLGCSGSSSQSEVTSKN